MDGREPPKAPDVPALEGADRLLAKVVAVWLWTIFFGLHGGLSYNYLSFFSQAMMLDRFGFGGSRAGGGVFFIWSLANGVGALASIGAWIFAYLFFSAYLMPVLFLGVGPTSEERRRRAGARFLNRAYMLMLLAGTARLAPELVAFVAPLLSGIVF